MNVVTKVSQPPASHLVGVGLYSISEAARLTGVPAQSIRRWLFGYRYRLDGESRQVAPVWHGQIPATDDALALGFMDMMEARFVHAFRQFGVGLQTIRLAARRASEVFGQDHPFTRRRFQTDGRAVFAELGEESGEAKLLDLARSQYAFRQVVRPSLHASIEFADGDAVLRWYPRWPRRSIALDPQISFGRPIVRDLGIPTESLAKAAMVEGSAERAARWFDVPVQAVRAAVAFEASLAA